MYSDVIGFLELFCFEAPWRCRVKAKVLILVALLSCSALPNSMEAHHASWQMYEDKSITLTGIVTNYEWTNPHSILSVAVKDDNGNIESCHAEILPPSEMLRAGWTKQSVKFGDKVTLTGRPGKYAQHIMWLEYLLTPKGRTLGRNS
jgi:hypothetical protein